MNDVIFSSDEEPCTIFNDEVECGKFTVPTETAIEVTPYHGMFDSDIKSMILSIYKGEPASKHAIKAELILNSCTDLPTEHIIALQKIIDGRIYVDIIEFYKDAGFKAPKRIRNNYKHHVRY